MVSSTATPIATDAVIIVPMSISIFRWHITPKTISTGKTLGIIETKPAATPLAMISRLHPSHWHTPGIQQPNHDQERSVQTPSRWSALNLLRGFAVPCKQQEPHQCRSLVLGHCRSTSGTFDLTVKFWSNFLCHGCFVASIKFVRRLRSRQVLEDITSQPDNGIEFVPVIRDHLGLDLIAFCFFW